MIGETMTALGIAVCVVALLLFASAAIINLKGT